MNHHSRLHSVFPAPCIFQSKASHPVTALGLACIALGCVSFHFPVQNTATLSKCHESSPPINGHSTRQETTAHQAWKEQLSATVHSCPGWSSQPKATAGAATSSSCPAAVFYNLVCPCTRSQAAKGFADFSHGFLGQRNPGRERNVQIHSRSRKMRSGGCSIEQDWQQNMGRQLSTYKQLCNMPQMSSLSSKPLYDWNLMASGCYSASAQK